MIGTTSYDNLWLNTGQGTLGWTLSCGSAELLSKMMLESDGKGTGLSMGSKHNDAMVA